MKSIHSDDYQLFVALIIEARRAAGLTQSELSQKINKPQSFISKYERAERRLDFVEVITICEALQLNPFTFLTHFMEKRSLAS